MLPAGINFLSQTSLIGETSTKALIRRILVCKAFDLKGASVCSLLL